MSPAIQAAAWMSGAVVSFTSMAIAGRAVSSELDTFELMMYRSFVGVIIVLVVARCAGTLHQVNLRHVRQHAIRNLAHFTGQNLWFHALPLIPLAQVFALEFTTPLWVILLAPAMLGERLTRTRILAAIIGFSGVLMVAGPDVAGLSPGVVSAALAAIGFAMTTVLTKHLTRRESTTTILFFLTTMQAAFGIITAGHDGDIALPDSTTAPWLLVIGCAGLMAHFCITRALGIAPASVVSPFDFARLPVIVVVGALLYDEPVHMLTLLGAVAWYTTHEKTGCLIGLFGHVCRHAKRAFSGLWMIHLRRASSPVRNHDFVRRLCLLRRIAVRPMTRVAQRQAHVTARAMTVRRNANITKILVREKLQFESFSPLNTRASCTVARSSYSAPTI